MMRVLYPGSFDPITKGHMDVIKQASDMFDEVVVAVMCNPLKKSSFFDIDERLELVKELYRGINNVKIITGSGASIDIALDNGCQAIIRGLRGLSDFDYEMQLAQINRDISNNKVNTICLFANSEYLNVSSSVVREVFALDKSVSKYVDPIVEERMLVKKRCIR